MTKTFLAAVALTLVQAGHPFAREAANPHRHHHRQQAPQPSPPPQADNSSIFWSPAGGNPVHYAQTTGFYAGR